MKTFDYSFLRDNDMMRYLSPMIDFGFKKIFCENEDILIDFLNEVVGTADKITDIKYLNPEQLGHTEIDRKAVYDIYCTTEQGDYYIIEMQCVKQKYFIDRALFYSTFPIQQQIEKGISFNFHFKKVIFIGLLDFILNESDDIIKTEATLYDVARNKPLSDVWKIIYLELPKFNKSLEELTTRYDKWLYLLTKLPQLHTMPIEFQDQIFTKVFQLCEVAHFTPDEFNTYQCAFKAYLDNNSAFYTAREEGLAEGLAKGIEQGAKKEQINFAKYLLSKNVPLTEIKELTKLSLEEIQKLD